MRRLLVVSIVAAFVLVALSLPRISGAFQNRRNAPSAKPASPAPAATTGSETRGKGGRAGRPISARAVNFGVSETLTAIAKKQSNSKISKAPANAEPLSRKKIRELRRNKEAGNGDASESGGLSSFDRIVSPFADEDQSIEKNIFNRQIIRQVDKYAEGTPDEAIAEVPSDKGERGRDAPRLIPSPGVSFEAIGNPEGCGGCLPPDTNGDIGPTQYVQTVNTAFRVYDRTGVPLTPTMTLGSLFATIPGPCASTNDGDPIVLYDQLADRWLISQFCVSVANPNNHQLIAISQTGDATGAYYLYDFMMPNNKFNDYPHFGMWPDAYYMTNNQFNQAGTQFLGGGNYAFDRSKMLAGDPTATYIYFDKAEGCPGACEFGGMLPTDLDGFIPPPPGAPNTVMQFDANEFGAPSDSLRIFDFHADFATPANSTFIERTGSPLAVAAFDPREVPANSRNVVPQPPPGVALDAISDRLLFRLAYRNFGTHESIVANHTVNAAVNPAFRAGVRYYEIRRSAPTAAWAVQEQATMAGAVGDLEHRWMGSTALNNAGSQAVGYSVSSSTVFPSIRYAGRLASDPPSSLAQGEATLIAGSGSQTSTSGRWGDYSDMTVDPLDDCTFWFTSEYYPATAGSTWKTRVGSFQFGPCPAIQKGVLTGTVTNAVTGTPIVGASVLASNGFGRASGAGGVYNIDPMGAGTVTLTVSAAGFAPATVPGVVVSTGMTTMQNVQLTPLSNIVAGAGTITADSCNSNMTLDPNETVTVNLPLQNIGGDGATTGNLVATLQATGGVTSPSGPQTYGAIVAGQPAVSRPFTFIVSASCGSTVTVTLQLQDGTTDLGTRTFTFQVGTLTGLFPTTGGIAVPIPDNNTTGVDIPINVPDNVSINDLNVRVRLNHTFDGDVEMRLVHPDGTIVLLSDNRGGSGANFGTGPNDCSGTPTVFDDQAATTIATGTAPFAGSFRPEGMLSTLNGKPSNGTWILRVLDNAAVDTGTVGCVTLEINKAFVCCGAEIVRGTPAPGYTITAESVAPANNAPDPDETVTVEFALANIGGSATTNLVGTLLPGGGVVGPSGPQTYGVLTSLGPAVSRPFTFAVAGACGGVITATIALQDGTTTLAPITFMIPIGGTAPATQTFSNTGLITIPTSGASSPYPSTINVAGLSGTVSKVVLTLNGLNHTFPDDVDMLLVGPGGEKFVIVSDTGGSNDWINANITLDDSAAANMSDGGSNPTGTYRPTSILATDTFAAPAPPAPYQHPATAGTATFASVFNGSSANGAWSLYVVDDAGGDTGTMTGGWSLTITAASPVCNMQTCTLNTPADITVPPDMSGTGAVVNYPAPTFMGSCGSVTSSPASGSFFPVGTTTVTVTATRADNSTTTTTFTVTVGTPPSQLLISELRTSGPGSMTLGSTPSEDDDFVEIYNNSNSAFTIPGSGYGLFKMGATCTDPAILIGTIPAGTIIPARGHYLFVGSTYSLSALAAGDQMLTSNIEADRNVALFTTPFAPNISLEARLDAVGFGSNSGNNCDLLREGTNQPLASNSNSEYSFVRKFNTTGGVLVDTNNNMADFTAVSTTPGTPISATITAPMLGAPGPENLTVPFNRNSTILSTALDPAAALANAPNRVRIQCPTAPECNPTTAQFGTIQIRRNFTNNTGGPVTRLRFRVIDITGFPVLEAGNSDLRLLNAPQVTGISLTGGGTATAEATSLEAPSQPNGGGFDSTVAVGVITMGSPLNAGETRGVNFLLGVQQRGYFRFLVNVEALP